MSEQNVQVTQALKISDCPFCGGEGHLNWRDGDRYFVECEDCEASTQDGTEDEAIAAWNHRTRAEPDLVEAAKRVLEWWPAPSEETSLAGKSYGGTFAADIQALRAAVTRADGNEGGSP